MCTIKILSIDGGGIRGIIPAIILSVIEEKTGKAIAELFDIIAGSSTGGLLALALTKPLSDGTPKYSAKKLIELYEQEGLNIFFNPEEIPSQLKPKYSSDGIERVLERYFEETLLSEALQEVLITSYDVEKSSPYFFKRYQAKAKPKLHHFPMAKVARATSAVPGYFQPLKLKLAQTVNQEINGSAVGPDTFVNGSNLTINPTGTLNQLINCEARNYGAPVDPRCDASNTAIYGSHGNTHPNPPPNDNNGGHNNHVPNVNQNVKNGGTNTTVIAPATANSNSNSSSNSSSTSDSSAAVSDSGNSSNTNLNVNQGGDARVGDQKNQMSVTTGASNVSPFTKVKVDGDQYNNIQFGSQAPGTGGEAFSFQYRSACGTGVSYHQGFALKPRRIAGGGFGYALDISNTEMDTIENRGSVQNKMNTAFQSAMSVVSNQQAFEQRLNTGGVSRQEAENHAIANCTPVHRSQESVQITNPPIDKPRNCTTQGCN